MRTIIMRRCWTLCIKLRFVSRAKEWKSSLFFNALCWQVIRNVLNSCLGMCYHREDWPGKQPEMHQKKPPCPRGLRSTTTNSPAISLYVAPSMTLHMSSSLWSFNRMRMASSILGFPWGSRCCARHRPSFERHWALLLPEVIFRSFWILSASSR